jgi:hypothetical protein
MRSGITNVGVADCITVESELAVLENAASALGIEIDFLHNVLVSSQMVSIGFISFPSIEKLLKKTSLK